MVQYLEINNNESKIGKINKSLKTNHCNIIAIYMPGCFHCEMLHPEWKIAAKKLSKVSNNQGIVSFINMKYMNHLNVNTSNVIGFPHIFAIKNGNQVLYNGPRDNTSLFKWMLTLCPSTMAKTQTRKKRQTTRKKRKQTKRKKRKQTKRKKRKQTKRKN